VGQGISVGSGSIVGSTVGSAVGSEVGSGLATAADVGAGVGLASTVVGDAEALGPVVACGSMQPLTTKAASNSPPMRLEPFDSILCSNPPGHVTWALCDMRRSLANAVERSTGFGTPAGRLPDPGGGAGLSNVTWQEAYPPHGAQRRVH
jgi:hypothetical protein